MLWFFSVLLCLYGSLVLWVCGSLFPWFPIVLWLSGFSFNASLVLWCSGCMVLPFCSSLVLRFYGSLPFSSMVLSVSVLWFCFIGFLVLQLMDLYFCISSPLIYRFCGPLVLRYLLFYCSSVL